jgi:hypothetical protein
MSRFHRGFAARRGRTTLYKFRPYRSDHHREWVRQIIADSKVYFSRRSELNDPFDLAPVFRIEKDRRKLLADAERVWARNGISVADLQRNRLKLASADLRTIEQDGAARALARIEENYWVFSLAGNREHPMLWSHYAEGHTGVCLHFCADEQSLFGAAQAVHYRPKRPVLPIPLSMLPEPEVAKRVTLTKGDFWRYEEEYRVLRFPDMDVSDLGLRFEGQHAFFPSRLLVGITVGARMAATTIESIRTLAVSHVPPLPAWRAREAASYKLKFELLT